MMIDQSMGLKFRTFEVMYSILSPAFMGSAVSAHGWSCNSPLLTTMSMCFFCLSVSTPTVDPPNSVASSGPIHQMLMSLERHQAKKVMGLTLGKKLRPRLFLGVKLKNWPMAAKELQPPATNLPRFIKKHWGMKKPCHWNLCCQQHDHMTTRPHDHKKGPKCGPNQTRTYES